MIPVKIQCGCGQKYAFDAEPVGGQMAGAVACPVCGADGTVEANAVISQTLAAQPPPTPPPVMRLQAVAAPVRSEPPPRPIAMPIPAAPAEKATGEFNLGLGILGALLGAIVGAGAMYGFYIWADFRFPLLGIGIGVLTGFGAKLLYKGTDNTLGIVSGVVAAIAVVGTLFLMYGSFPLLSIISVIVSISMAYRIASG